MRNFLKNQLFSLARKILLHQRGRDALDDSLGNRLKTSPTTALTLQPAEVPYSGIGTSSAETPTRLRDDIVFITGRFRSGSTLMWNIFRSLDGFDSYYEPFNERRWFDSASRGERVDRSHRGVQGDYWREYDSISGLDEFYDEEWIRRDLYMDEKSVNWPMHQFIEQLVAQSSERPVLQFNRIDFRLPWIRKTFPNATILHICRHPRDQWCSSLMDIQRFGTEAGGLEEFDQHDGFYLNTWVNDLQYWFPFLRERDCHPYRHFYFLWRLSQVFGQQYADSTLRLEDLVLEPRSTLEPVFDRLGYALQDWSRLDSLIKPPTLERWKRYASAEWFEQHESYCETVLADFFSWETPGVPTSFEALPVSDANRSSFDTSHQDSLL